MKSFPFFPLRVSLVLAALLPFAPPAAGRTSWDATVKAGNADARDSFGWSVAISGDTIVVGAIWEDSGAAGVNGNGADDSKDDSGAAYVFTRSGTVWAQQAYLKASNPDAMDHFGQSVAIDGDRIIVGARGEDGGAVGVSGGANQADNSVQDNGAAYTFRRTSGAWQPSVYLKGASVGAGDEFGFSVAISGGDGRCRTSL